MMRALLLLPPIAPLKVTDALTTSPRHRAVGSALAVVGQVRELVAAGADAQPAQLARRVRQRAPRAPHALAHAHDRARTHLDHVVVEAHLAAALEEHVQLLDLGVAVPVSGLLPRRQRVGGHAHVLHRQLVVHDAASLARGGGEEAAHVVAPGVKGADLGDLVVAHHVSIIPRGPAPAQSRPPAPAPSCPLAVHAIPLARLFERDADRRVERQHGLRGGARVAWAGRPVATMISTPSACSSRRARTTSGEGRPPCGAMVSSTSRTSSRMPTGATSWGRVTGGSDAAQGVPGKVHSTSSAAFESAAACCGSCRLMSTLMSMPRAKNPDAS